MKKAILIRHGESEANIRGILSDELNHYSLTDNGRKQAERIGHTLDGYHIDGIFSSPVLRARETAGIISKILNVRVEIDNGLRESGLGDLNGKPFRSLPFGGREEFGMEPWSSLTERMSGTVDKHEGSYVYVSHALPIRALVAHYLNLSEIDSYGIEIRYASASALDVSAKQVLCIGSLRPSEAVRESFRN